MKKYLICLPLLLNNLLLHSQKPFYITTKIGVDAGFLVRGNQKVSEYLKKGSVIAGANAKLIFQKKKESLISYTISLGYDYLVSKKDYEKGNEVVDIFAGIGKKLADNKNIVFKVGVEQIPQKKTGFAAQLDLERILKPGLFDTNSVIMSVSYGSIGLLRVKIGYVFVIF